MASLLGECGNAVLSGTCSSTSPAILADFRPSTGNGISKGVDGYPCNAYELTNRDTTSTLILNVQIQALHDNASTQSFACYPGDPPRVFQNGEHANALQLIKGWLTTLTNGTTSSSTYVSGGVIVRRN